MRPIEVDSRPGWLLGAVLSLFASGQLMAQAHVGQYEQADIAFGSSL